MRTQSQVHGLYGIIGLRVESKGMEIREMRMEYVYVLRIFNLRANWSDWSDWSDWHDWHDWRDWSDWVNKVNG
jgi:hypothetical protein